MSQPYKKGEGGGGAAHRLCLITNVTVGSNTAAFTSGNKQTHYSYGYYLFCAQQNDIFDHQLTVFEVHICCCIFILL